ncbi:MAG: hypothetical protein HWD59_08745 [Coxiellaceae bacterium]|nr:MAG: hypothetical protein HWD59_08745 [Coxiellaceae bacterium]
MPEILGAELHEMACNTITRQFENLYSAKHTIDPTLTELGNYLFTRSQKLVKQLGHNKIYQFFHRAEVKSRLNKNYLKVRLLSLTKVAEFQNPAASPDFLLDLATTLTEIFHEAIENKTAADLLGNFVENDNCIEGTSASYFGYADFLYGCYHLLLALNSETNPGYHQNSASIHLTRAAVAKVPFTMAKELLDISSNTNNNSVRGKISLECTAFDSDSITSTQLSLIIQNSEKHMSSIIKSIFQLKTHQHTRPSCKQLTINLSLKA